MQFKLKSFRIIDRTNSLLYLNESNHNQFDPLLDENSRYQTIFKSESSGKHLIQIDFFIDELKSPRYNNKEMYLDVKLGKATLNLNPISLNKLLRFLRFYQYPKDTYVMEKLRIQQSIRIKLDSL